MARRARWWVMLQAAKDEALLAVDLYNRPLHRRSFEGFVVHMHIAWTYLLHAGFHRVGLDYRHWNKKHTRLIRVDGEPKTWELAECVRNRWPESDPVRKNIEFFIGLRNKIEHRYQDTVAVATVGHAQAHILNFEEEVVNQFGDDESVAGQLRFPIFLHTFTEYGHEALREIRARLPGRTSKYLSEFHSGLDQSVRDDQRFEFRLRLIPHLGPKSEADMAIEFVRLDELTDEDKDLLARMGRTGRVIVRERHRPVVHLGRFRPKDVVEEVQRRVPVRFTMHDFVEAWRALDVRPSSGSPHPERTDEKYCFWDEVHRDYVYTQAFVEKLVREVSSPEGYESFFGRPAREAELRPAPP